MPPLLTEEAWSGIDSLNMRKQYKTSQPQSISTRKMQFIGIIGPVVIETRDSK